MSSENDSLSNLPLPFTGAYYISDDECELVADLLKKRQLFRYYGLDGFHDSVASRVETKLSQFLDVDHCVLVNSGTSALEAALCALEVGPGDEVLVPAYTWMATATAVLALGATPRIVDIDETMTIKPESVREGLNTKTKVVIPVHIRGRPCNMSEIQALCVQSNVEILEDASQAFGASWQERKVGTWGRISAFSFQMNKIITCGEGGAIATSSKAILERSRMHSDLAAGAMIQGREGSILPWLLGHSHRMAEIPAAILESQLAKFSTMKADLHFVRQQFLNHVDRDRLIELDVVFAKTEKKADPVWVSEFVIFPEVEMAQKFGSLLPQKVVLRRIVHRLYDPKFLDLHIFVEWKPVLDRAICDATNSLDLLSRTFAINFAPVMRRGHVHALAGLINECLDAL
ncbi:MAG: aminotransferase class I/II-fold pyridoxal phosphate-dependent enzyme [Planctomycetes bacterium]|nr:aminotransferase class I/II-fold pyridoxal phosphate-dependent enzyme [Planctomycetota bacterium]